MIRFVYPGKLSDKATAKAFTEQGEKLYRWEGWNTIVIRCEGNPIRTRLNGEAHADFKDDDKKDFTSEGFIALQVHGGKVGHVRWQNIFLKEL